MNPGASPAITVGINTSKDKINNNSDIVNTEKILPANFNADFLPSTSSLLEKRGTKAALKAPSAKIFLNKLGSLKATFRESANIPVPKKDAISMSRMKPNILETKVKNENIELDFKNTFSI